MTIAETDRLRLRRLSLGDAPFIRRLVNEPAWLRHIGDKSVRTLADARRYLRDGPIDSYRRHGFGLYHVARCRDRVALGICGLVKRDGLTDADLGYAFLSRFWGNGYAREAAVAIIAHARRDLGLTRLVAITAPDNGASSRVLEAVGFVAAGRLTLPGRQSESLYYVHDVAPGETRKTA